MPMYQKGVQFADTGKINKNHYDRSTNVKLSKYSGEFVVGKTKSSSRAFKKKAFQNINPNF
jgi:hypothetical protein